MPKCDFNKVVLQLDWNRTSAWVFACKYAAYFQNTFSKNTSGGMLLTLLFKCLTESKIRFRLWVSFETTVHISCSTKYLFWKISQNIQENTYDRDSIYLTTVSLENKSTRLLLSICFTDFLWFYSLTVLLLESCIYMLNLRVLTFYILILYIPSNIS